MTLTEKQKEERYKYYLERHNTHEKWHESLSHNLDKLILGLSSGTLVLSVTFIDKIIGLGEIQTLYLIIMSWIFLLITLIINIATYFFSMRASVRARKILKDWFNSGKEDAPETNNWLGKTANGLNTLSLITLALGILFLTRFAINNINIINTMNNDEQNKQTEQGTEKSSAPHTEPEFAPLNSGGGDEGETERGEKEDFSESPHTDPKFTPLNPEKEEEKPQENNKK